jgi:trans-aconitate 2-methyltransferase
MSTWNSEHYLKFGDERTRPAADLAARIKLAAPCSIADLGCGPGNSTQVLRTRWPSSQVVGIDNSPDMISAARVSFPDQEWLLCDVSVWTPATPVDLVFSNAALQWLPDHAVLMPRLFSCVARGGAFAFQIPSGTFATVRTLIHEISRKAIWDGERMQAARNALTMESPAFYYDVLAGAAAEVDIWETEYHHVMDSPASIVDWISSTGLRPFLAAAKDAAERDAFLSELHRRVENAYETRSDGKVLFPFRRTFVIAYR